MPPPILPTYSIYGNKSDKTISVEVFKSDQNTRVISFSIEPKKEYSYATYNWPFGEDGVYVIVSNGEYKFTQLYENSGDYSPSSYLFKTYFYQEQWVINSVKYYKYVFTDYDFSKESGNNLTEVPN